MNKLILIAILVFGQLSCTEGQQELLGEIIEIHPPQPASLRLENQLKGKLTITSWSMSGYEFNDLDIRPGQSEQFVLVNGIPQQSSRVTVTVTISSATQSVSTTHRVNFTLGWISTLSISECAACEEVKGKGILP